jgi:enoyl-[acyl-carrier protein] reductase I
MGFLAGKRLLITGCCPTVPSPTALPAPATARGPNWPSAMSASVSRNASPNSPAEFGSKPGFRVRRGDDAQIERLFASSARPGRSSTASCTRSPSRRARRLRATSSTGSAREGFRIAHEISAYSFPAMAKAALPLPACRQGRAADLTYLGVVRAVPNYNTMGLAKASLEASVRYLAAERWARKGIRVNGISAGPIKTLAAARSRRSSGARAGRSRLPPGRARRCRSPGRRR